MSDGARPPETEEPAAGGGPPPGWPSAPQSPYAPGKTLHGEPAAFGPAFPSPDAVAPIAPAIATPGLAPEVAPLVPVASTEGPVPDALLFAAVPDPAVPFAAVPDAAAPVPPLTAPAGGTSMMSAPVEPLAPGGATQIGAVDAHIEPPPATIPGADLPAYAPAAAPMMPVAVRPASAAPKSRTPLLVGILALAVAATGIGGFVVYRQNNATDPDATVDVPKKKKKKKPAASAAPTSEPTPAAPSPPPPEPSEEPVEEEPTAEPSAEPAPSATNTTPKPGPTVPKPAPSSSAPKPGPSSSGTVKPQPSSSTSPRPTLKPKGIGKLRPIAPSGGGPSSGGKFKMPGIGN